MAVDLETLTPREFVAGLMRGERASFKLGYSAEAAYLSAVGYFAAGKALRTEEAGELRAYAHGFAAGIGGGFDPDYEGLESFEAGRADGGEERLHALNPATTENGI